MRMICATTFGVLLLGTAAFGQRLASTGSGGYGPNSNYVLAYNQGSVVDFSGKVTGVLRSAPAKGMEPSVSLLVKSSNGGTSNVELGPTWYVDGYNVRFKVGDRVRGRGSKIFVDGKSTILVQQITKNGRVLYCRGEDGWPMWLAYRGHVTVMANTVQPSQVNVTGTISNIRTVQLGANLTPTVILDVNTETGNQTFNLGPVWFITRQDMFLEVGNVIVLTGARPVGGFIPVIDLRRCDEWMRLRDLNGRGIWEMFGGG
jgi:hypothetical protein